MAMFSFDEQAALFDVTPLPNQFILNYLPEASGDAVRVYLFGLVACYHHEAISDLQQMARELNMTEDDIPRGVPLLGAQRGWCSAWRIIRRSTAIRTSIR